MVIFGNITAINSKLIQFKNITEIHGNVNLENSLIKSFGKLKIIHGSLTIRNCKNIISLNNIEEIGRNFYAEYSSIENLGNLQRVGFIPNKGTKKRTTSGLVDLTGCKNIKSLGNLKEINYILRLEDSGVISLGKLEQVKSIHGFKDFDNTYPHFTIYN